MRTHRLRTLFGTGEKWKTFGQFIASVSITMCIKRVNGGFFSGNLPAMLLSFETRLQICEAIAAIIWVSAGSVLILISLEEFSMVVFLLLRSSRFAGLFDPLR